MNHCPSQCNSDRNTARSGFPRHRRPYSSREKRSTILCLLLVLLTLAFYNPVVHNGFTNMDDDIYITGNAHVRAGLTWATVKWAFTSYRRGQLAPAHLAVACARLPAFQAEPRRSSLCECPAARVERDLAVSAARKRYGLNLAKLDGGGAVRASSRKCRVGGVGCGAEERAEHAVLLAYIACLWMVCA